MTTTSSIDLINSQIDVATIVSNLIYVDAAPIRRMQSQVSTLQSKISAFQTINTRLSTLANKVDNLLYGSSTEPLNHPYAYGDRLSSSIFSQCKVTSSDETAISATADNANYGGAYSVTVTNLAEAESWASANFANTTLKTGTGNLIIETADDSVTITIDESNNTLVGVCNAINEANAGVTASIINDGTPNTPLRLLITASDSGSDYGFSINEDGLTGGQALQMAQKQAASDAVFVMNGVTITKGSNTVSDVIPGVTFTLKNETTSAVKLTVDKDVDGIIAALNEFVSAYNAVNSYINSQFSYDSTTKKSGLLSGDTSLRNIQTNLQNRMIQSVSNRFTDFNVSGQVGIEFNRDGSLSLDAAKLRSALTSDFTSVAALFLGNGTPANSATASDSRVTYNSKTAATQSGIYSIEITDLAQKASTVGGQAITTTLSETEHLTIISGGNTAYVTLEAGYDLQDVLDAINDELSAHGMEITATDDGTNKVKITANNYGSDGSFTIASDLGETSGTGFGTSTVEATGTDIAGLINGHEATGSGLTLTGASGESEEGLMLTIAQTATGEYGSITVSSGNTGVEGESILMNLHTLMEGITDPLSGPIHNSEDALSQSIKYLNEEISDYQLRLDVEEEILTQQFNKADEALKLLQVTQSSISSQLAKLS
jgi:flagellar hook-associated protein 2